MIIVKEYKIYKCLFGIYTVHYSQLYSFHKWSLHGLTECMLPSVAALGIKLRKFPMLPIALTLIYSTSIIKS